MYIPCMRARHSTSMRSIWCGILFHPRIIISLSLYLVLDMVLFVDTEQMKSEMLSTETLPCVRVLVFTNRNRDSVTARNFITLTRKNGNNRRASSSKAVFLDFHCVSKPTKSKQEKNLPNASCNCIRYNQRLLEFLCFFLLFDFGLFCPWGRH